MEKKKKSIVVQLLQDYRFNSILFRNFAMIFAAMLCMFLGVMFLVSNWMDTLIEKEVASAGRNNLRQTMEHMDSIMNEVMQISAKLALDDDIMGFLLTDTAGDPDGQKAVSQAKNKLNQYAGIFDYVDSIYVYSARNKYIVTEESGEKIGLFDDLTWYENLTERIYEPARMISRKKYNRYPYLITYIQPVRLTQMYFLGGILINIDVEKAGKLAALQEDDNLFIIDKRNNILYSSDTDYNMKKWDQLPFFRDYDGSKGTAVTINADGKQMLLLQMDSDKFDWSYASMVPMEKYQNYRKTIQRLIGAAALVMIVLVLICSVLISFCSYEPVKSILSLLKNPAEYDRSRIEGFRKDETQEIVGNIIHNFYSNNQLQEEVKEYLEITERAQLTALQAQISPHFLYNTLENIRWRAIEVCRGDNDISRSILNLSRLLRNSLDHEAPIISLQEELENTRIYIEILQLRYQDRLSFEWEIDEALLDCQIVKVSLQPLIENAVYHGIKPLREKGIIRIRTEAADGKVLIYVTDNGVGISEEDTQLLNRDLQDKYQQKEGHIGIRNVNQRLKLLLGDEAGITVESKKGEGTSVIMSIPYRVLT